MLCMYVIRDKVAKLCGPVLTVRNEAVALRQYHNMFVENPLVNRNDYELLFIGNMQEETGEIIPVPPETVNQAPSGAEV